MVVDGIVLSDLPDEFGDYVPGDVLILDGDLPAYAVAATVKTVPTAVRHYQQRMLQAMFLAECGQLHVHLTHEASLKAGRFMVKATKPYQGQRSSSAKPPLLGSVRQAVSQPENWLPEYDVVMHHMLEADDGMMIQAYQYGEHGIIRSEDKDLRMTPFRYYDIKIGKCFAADPVGHLYIDYTESGSKKLLGHSLKFFWAQLMMGDQADNIAGLQKLHGKNVGLVGTFEFLDPMKDINEIANAVIDQFRAINQNPIPEAWLLWLLRTPDDSFWRYCHELEWSPVNWEFLNECITRDWYIKDDTCPNF